MDEEGLFTRAREKAFRLLGIRARGEEELRLRLRSGNFPPSVVEDVIERCRELGYIDDGNFARQRARALAANQLAGNRKIAFDLRGKGIDPDVSAEAIADIGEELDEGERIRRLLKKRRPGRAAAKTAEKEKAKLIRYLMGKGFSLELILKIFNDEEKRIHDDDGQ
jgi:regulatory protein